MSNILVSEHANMQGIAALHGAILSALDEHPAVTLDLGEVADTDLAFLQLVESARREAARRDRTLALAAPATGAVRCARRSSAPVSSASRTPMHSTSGFMGDSPQ